MSKIVDKIVTVSCGLKDGPGLHGADIVGAYVYAGVVLKVLTDDKESPHDGWVQIAGPIPDPVRVNGTWKSSKKIAWIEYAHLSDIDASGGKKRYILEIDENGTPNITRIA